jgi:hypothetical protein
MRALYLVIITILFGISCSINSITNAYSQCGTNVDCGNGYPAHGGSSPIIISRDTFSPSSKVDILIHAPDFNSNSYAIDTIGIDGSDVVISTREGSIPYKLVETGPDTGDFAGYVILSSTTSTCSPVCGPTDGLLAAGGDDAITVSFTYAVGHTISSTSYGTIKSQTNPNTIPEFPFAEIMLISSMIFLIFLSNMKFTR